MRTMNLSTARRIALAAQGFADPRPTGTPDRRHLRRVLGRVRLLQLDSVNVAVRAHYAPLFARLGRYDRALVDDAAWSHSASKPRLLVEYWAHAACLVPVADWPLLRWRMRQFERHYADDHRSIAVQAPHLGDKVLRAVQELGPIGAGPLEDAIGMPSPRSKGGWWDRSDVKRACEWLFATGELTTATRNGFERRYDLPERVLPQEVLTAPEPSQQDAARELVARAASAFGIGTETDLRDYYRLPPAASRQAVADLVQDGVLEPVQVHGWGSEAYKHVDARAPRSIGARALLCPFDPVVWNRDRAERLFGFSYRIEIYVPEARRRYGYYVFPFLLDDQLVARVDLKADRAAGVLRVPGTFAESGVDTRRVARELAAELRLMAEWLGLDDVVADDRGALAGPLRRALDARD